MTYQPAEWVDELDQRLAAGDSAACQALCADLCAALYRQPEPFPEAQAKRLMKLLRKKRQFALMQQVGDVLLQTGQTAFEIERQYAQALLDGGRLTAAIAVLTQLLGRLAASDPAAAGVAVERAEAGGLLGRAHKQAYVNADNPRSSSARQHLHQAIAAYQAVYATDPALHTWHGINVVALACRARRDGVELAAPLDVQQLATAILQASEARLAQGGAWNLAIVAEANLALGDLTAALERLDEYVGQPDADAFELGGTLRQLTEVWQLPQATDEEKKLLPILQAALLRREGGRLELPVATLLQQQQEAEGTRLTYEKVFGNDAFQTYTWYQRGAARCQTVARIGRQPELGEGTGFLMRGDTLHPQLQSQLVLLTNAHVLTDDPAVYNALRLPPLRPAEAYITFELLDPGYVYRVGKLVWSSPPSSLDTTIVQFSTPDQQRLEALLAAIEPYPLAELLPIVSALPQRVYAIGHPNGRMLSLSLQDNVLLDHQSPYIHYRTPTVGGSSGSPLFNQQWELIGIHHGGGVLPRLNNQPGNYEANEGLWVQAIRRALQVALGTDPKAPG